MYATAANYHLFMTAVGYDYLPICGYIRKYMYLQNLKRVAALEGRFGNPDMRGLLMGAAQAYYTSLAHTSGTASKPPPIF